MTKYIHRSLTLDDNLEVTVVADPDPSGSLLLGFRLGRKHTTLYFSIHFRRTHIAAFTDMLLSLSSKVPEHPSDEASSIPPTTTSTVE